jgi:hypothetical protein
MSKLSGGLLTILRYSRVAWYVNRETGIHAYYEHPTIHADGQIVVNGRQISRLVIDAQGLYLDRPSPDVQRMMIAHGLDLEQGWSCTCERIGQAVTSAMKESPSRAARYYDGRFAIQQVERRVIVFVRGRKCWTVPLEQVGHLLGEWGADSGSGWYALKEDLLAYG